MKALSAIFAGVYLLSAGLQFNDPDPVGWIAIYSAAAVLGGVTIFRPAPAAALYLVASISTLWAISIFMGASAVSPDWIEERREIGGLLLVTIGLIVIAVLSKRQVPGESG